MQKQKGIGEKKYSQIVNILGFNTIENYQTFIDKEIDEYKRQIRLKSQKLGFANINDFLKFLKEKDKINGFKELLEYLNNIKIRIISLLKNNNIFANLDNIKFKIIKTPKELEDNIPFAEYNKNGNVLYFTFKENCSENYKQSFLDTFIHEFIPGHTLYFENIKDIVFENDIIDNIFTEGRALYAEKLMEELNFYNQETSLAVDSYIYLRILRMKLDLLLQTNKINFDKAVNILMREMKYDKNTAKGEIGWYITSPGIPSAYYIGYKIIIGLRQKYFLIKGKQDYIGFHNCFFNFLNSSKYISLNFLKNIEYKWNNYILKKQ